VHISRAVLWTAAAFCIVAVAGASWFVVAYGFSARAKPTALETFLARHARRLATEPGARSLRNLLSPTSLNVAEARDHFADHCAIRHANITAVAKPKSTPASIPCAGLAKVRNSGPRL
jgi:hypothetical protein